MNITLFSISLSGHPPVERTCWIWGNLSPFINADMTLSCGCMPKSLGQINLIEMNLIRTVNKLLCFIQRLVNTDGSPESHEITFVDRVRFSQNKMYLLQNDISWGLERMSDHEILYNRDNYIQVVCDFKCTDHDIP